MHETILNHAKCFAFLLLMCCLVKFWVWPFYYTENNLNCSVVPKNYQHILALAFAVEEINENPTLLPNATLGFHIYDSFYNAEMTYKATLNLLSTQHRLVTNYKCDVQNNLIAIIGGLDSWISLCTVTITNTYKIPQVGCESFFQWCHYSNKILFSYSEWFGVC